jgi:hypothetical protein
LGQRDGTSKGDLVKYIDIEARRHAGSERHHTHPPHECLAHVDIVFAHVAQPSVDFSARTTCTCGAFRTGLYVAYALSDAPASCDVTTWPLRISRSSIVASPRAAN